MLSSKVTCKLLRNLPNKLVIAQNIHTVSRCRPFFLLSGQLGSLFNLRAEVTLKPRMCRGMVGDGTSVLTRYYSCKYVFKQFTSLVFYKRRHFVNSFVNSLLELSLARFNGVYCEFFSVACSVKLQNQTNLS